MDLKLGLCLSLDLQSLGPVLLLSRFLPLRIACIMCFDNLPYNHLALGVDNTQSSGGIFLSSLVELLSFKLAKRVEAGLSVSQSSNQMSSTRG